MTDKPEQDQAKFDKVLSRKVSVRPISKEETSAKIRAKKEILIERIRKAKEWQRQTRRD
jgi:hypothetical protein